MRIRNKGVSPLGGAPFFHTNILLFDTITRNARQREEEEC